MSVKTLQGRILFWAGMCLVVTTLAVVGSSALSVRSAASEGAREMAVSEAMGHAGKIKATMDVALDAGRTLAQVLASVKTGDSDVSDYILDRDQVVRMFKTVLVENPDFVGTYTGWEPNAFDAMDDGYANTDGHDDTGRFIPYINRNEAGEIMVEPLLDYEVAGAGDYYQLPKMNRAECVIDPYIYPVQGKETLITSLVAPIMSGSQFLGIAGVDLRLDFLQRMADSVDTETLGKMLLISNNGSLAGATGRPDLIGKPVDQFDKKFMGKGLLGRIQNGELFVDAAADELSIYVPITFGKSLNPWSVNIRIPSDLIMAEANRMMWRQVLIGGFCILAALAVLWFVARSISIPINRIITGLDESAGQVASGANVVSATSQSLAEGSSEQAASIEETSSSLEEMSAMTRQNANNARQADTLMKDTNQVVSQATGSMDELTCSMEAITRASDETRKIVKTIDEIAFQTNLLALNAAVEAARAGDAGAGFAVVADEVRNLAIRAAEAASSTAELIDETLMKVQGGKALVGKTGDAFTAVAGSAAKVSELIGEISAASGEQAQGIDQINKAAAEMDKVVQTVAANAEESASASEEMNAQAEQMKAYVSSLVRLTEGRKNGHKGRKCVGWEQNTTIHNAQRSMIKEKRSHSPVFIESSVGSRDNLRVQGTMDDKDFQDF